MAAEAEEGAGATREQNNNKVRVTDLAPPAPLTLSIKNAKMKVTNDKRSTEWANLGEHVYDSILDSIQTKTPDSPSNTPDFLGNEKEKLTELCEYFKSHHNSMVENIALMLHLNRVDITNQFNCRLQNLQNDLDSQLKTASKRHETDMDELNESKKRNEDLENQLLAAEAMTRKTHDDMQNEYINLENRFRATLDTELNKMADYVNTQTSTPEMAAPRVQKPPRPETYASATQKHPPKQEDQRLEPNKQAPLKVAPEPNQGAKLPSAANAPRNTGSSRNKSKGEEKIIGSQRHSQNKNQNMSKEPKHSNHKTKNHHVWDPLGVYSRKVVEDPNNPGEEMIVIDVRPEQKRPSFKLTTGQKKRNQQKTIDEKERSTRTVILMGVPKTKYDPLNKTAFELEEIKKSIHYLGELSKEHLGEDFGIDIKVEMIKKCTRLHAYTGKCPDINDGEEVKPMVIEFHEVDTATKTNRALKSAGMWKKRTHSKWGKYKRSENKTVDRENAKHIESLKNLYTILSTTKEERDNHRRKKEFLQSDEFQEVKKFHSFLKNRRINCTKYVTDENGEIVEKVEDGEGENDTEDEGKGDPPLQNSKPAQTQPNPDQPSPHGDDPQGGAQNNADAAAPDNAQGTKGNAQATENSTPLDSTATSEIEDDKGEVEEITATDEEDGGFLTEDESTKQSVEPPAEAPNKPWNPKDKRPPFSIPTGLIKLEPGIIDPSILAPTNLGKVGHSPQSNVSKHKTNTNVYDLRKNNKNMALSQAQNQNQKHG